MTTDVTKDMNANEDFLNLAVSAHVYNSSSNQWDEYQKLIFPTVLSGMHSDSTAALTSLVHIIISLTSLSQRTDPP